MEMVMYICKQPMPKNPAHKKVVVVRVQVVNNVWLNIKKGVRKSAASC